MITELPKSQLMPFQQFKMFKPSSGFRRSPVVSSCCRTACCFARGGRNARFAFLIGQLLIACSAPPKIALQYGNEFTQTDLAKVLAENPLGAAEDVRLTTLGQGADASQHIVQIRDREIPHTHDTHDTTIFMMRGSGYLVMDGRRIDLTAGDVIHIPRAIPHYYVNTASEPTVAFVVFAPPFDGKDNMPLSAR